MGTFFLRILFALKEKGYMREDEVERALSKSAAETRTSSKEER